MAIIKQPLSNLNLSRLGADISTGGGYAFDAYATPAVHTGRTSLGDTFKLASKNISIPGLADGGILGKYDGYYRNGNISFSSLFSGSYLDGSLGQVVYHKNKSIDAGQWRSNVPGAPYYTSNGSASAIPAITSIPLFRATSRIALAGSIPTLIPNGTAKRPVPTPISIPLPCFGVNNRRASSSDS